MSVACKRKLFGTTALVSVLALPAVAAMAGAVGTRSPDELANGFGRAGTDAYWIQQKPTDVPAPVVNAYNATKEVVTDTYNEVKARAAEPPTQQAPERYGRAGGYVGLGILQSPESSKTSSVTVTAPGSE